MAEPTIGQLILKVHGRCNLACDYCYVYESVDQSWRDKPASMSPRVAHAVGHRIAEYARAHDLPRMGITLHGGEPLLVSIAELHTIIKSLQDGVGGNATLDLGMQTNGVLLDHHYASYLRDEGISVGISLDGGREANDRHRRFAHGGSSFDTVARAVRLLGSPPYRNIFSGVLATVDPANDPLRLFDDLLALDPGQIDLLLPHATWDTPPPAARAGETVYGDWLVAFFDTWYDAPPRMGVRLFQEAMHALLGGASRAEAIGASVPGSLVIETDGSFERSDTLKVAYAGAPETGCNVFDHRIDDVLNHARVKELMRGRDGLAEPCQTCPIVGHRS
jgi:uncharacterized protein